MKQVDIAYNGITRSPSDLNCKDGDLAECVNLIVENGEMKPVSLPPLLFNCDAELLFIHKGHTYRNYIVNKGGLLRAFRQTSIGIEYYTFDMNISNVGEIFNISCLGNTLILSCKGGMHYLLFKDGNYKVLGKKPPFVPLSFGLKGTIKTSDTFKINIADVSSGSIVFSFSEENKNIVTSEIVPRINKFINDNTSGGKFMYPFFVRYALRLYDNSISMHSAPVLMLPSSGMSPQVFMTDYYQVNGKIKNIDVLIKAFACTLDYRYSGDELNLSELKKWNDIIKSVDVFISEPILTYDQNASCTGIENANTPSSPCFGILNLDGETSNSIPIYKKQQIPFDANRPWMITTPTVNKNTIRENIENCSLFYKIASIPINELNNTRKNIPINGNIKSSLTLQERMSDDYNSHNAIHSKYAYVYNSRLNLSSITQDVFNGFKPESMASFDNAGAGNPITVDTIVYTFIRENEKEIIVKSQSNIQVTSLDFYAYYPNKNAYKMIIKCTPSNGNSSHVEIKLIAHKNLNGAFYFGAFNDLNWSLLSGPDPVVSLTPEIYTPNKIYTSEVNNPFVFPVSGINTIGVGEILGIASATKALSQGQFGQFPLYAFTNEGIWALEVSSTGTYSSRQVVTRDVCNNPASITQIDGAIIFTSDRGVMILQGSETQCISDIMNGKHFRPDSLESISAYKPDIDNVIVDISDKLSFIDYTRACTIAYDYPNARLIFNNQNTRYQYVYSLRSGTFSKLHHGKKIPRVINSYPDCYLQDTSGNIYNYSRLQDENDSTERSRGIIITRPLSFASTSLKTITRILNRGIYKQPSFVKIGLHGSRDGVTYRKIRSLHGIPWKYFRIVLYTSLLPTERMSYTSLVIEERFTNKIR